MHPHLFLFLFDTHLSVSGPLVPTNRLAKRVENRGQLDGPPDLRTKTKGACVCAERCVCVNCGSNWIMGYLPLSLSLGRMRAACPHRDALSRTRTVSTCRRPNDRPTGTTRRPERERSAGTAENIRLPCRLSSEWPKSLRLARRMGQLVPPSSESSACAPGETPMYVRRVHRRPSVGAGRSRWVSESRGRTWADSPRNILPPAPGRGRNRPPGRWQALPVSSQTK